MSCLDKKFARFYPIYMCLGISRARLADLVWYTPRKAQDPAIVKQGWVGGPRIERQFLTELDQDVPPAFMDLQQDILFLLSVSQGRDRLQHMQAAFDGDRAPEAKPCLGKEVTELPLGPVAAAI